MINDINMEFIQAFNPLYFIPIAAVIFCAFLVYAFGLKSSVQPPSFDGIEEDKKYSKKRKTNKEVQKQNKLITNGRLNGVATNKGKSSEPPKKKETEKIVTNEKSSSNEKVHSEKKATKKAKSQSDKKSLPERKKENASHDDMNEDGWVQLVSKKGRKNRKKDDGAVNDSQLYAASSTKAVETKSDDSSQVEDSPKRMSESPDVSASEKKLDEFKPVKEALKKDVPTDKTSSDKAVVQAPPVDVKPEINVDINLNEAAAKVPKVFEETNKSKKKKKKQSPPENEKNETAGSISHATTVDFISKIPPQDSSKFIITPAPEVPLAIPDDKTISNPPTEVKSNVAFDELAGLYPETKEKKKKKVRRDH